METIQQTRKCNKCGAQKPHTDFYVVNKANGYRRRTCKECVYQKKSNLLTIHLDLVGGGKSFYGVSSYEVGDTFFRIEDQESINLFKISEIKRVEIVKAEAVVKSNAPSLKITPQLMD